MSYLDEVKQEVEDAKAGMVDTYKQFMSDFVIPDFVKTKNKSSHIQKIMIINHDIDCELFLSWLEEERFLVETLPNNDIIITLNN